MDFTHVSDTISRGYYHNVVGYNLRIFEIISFGFVVAIFDLVHDVEAILYRR